MKTNAKRSTVPTRWSRGRWYTDFDKRDLAVLAGARQWLNANGMKEHSAFMPDEADRRVAFYAAQIAVQGQITRWLAAAPPKPRTRYRTRFAFGDVLGRHMTACQA